MLSFKTPLRSFRFSLALIAIYSVIWFKCLSITHLPQIGSAHVLQNYCKLNVLCAPETASESTPDFIEVVTVEFYIECSVSGKFLKCLPTQSVHRSVWQSEHLKHASCSVHMPQKWSSITGYRLCSGR